MKNKINLINGITLFFALSLFLIISLFVVSSNNYKQHEQELKNHLSLISSLYEKESDKNGDAAEIVALYKASNPNLRISFISLTGEVIYDSENIEVYENHSDRPELLNRGVIDIRYSETLDVQMMYLADVVAGTFVRVAVPVKSINSLVNSFLIIGLLTLVIITFISIIIINHFNKQALAPLNTVVTKLSAIVGQPAYAGDDVERMSIHINEVNNLINDKINEITDEKSKANFIINSLNQGVIVVDNDGNIILVNKFILDLRNFSEADILFKNYAYLIRNLDFQEKIVETIKNGISFNFDLREEQYIFSVNITPVTSKWTGQIDPTYGVFISIIDVTEERNIEKVKREFFANASHELKTPLTTIIGYQQMITENIITTPEEVYDASKRTIKEATRMHQIILEMLDLSKLETKEPTKVEPINLQEIVEDILDHYESDIEDKNLKVELELNELVVNLNFSHANQLVKNLIENAIKYNKKDGILEIKLIPQTRELIVRDSGIGIAAADQGRIFERFYRVDKARSKDQGGTGLGLAIVKHICNLYEANIVLHSKRNQGTSIKIQFNPQSTIKQTP